MDKNNKSKNVQVQNFLEEIMMFDDEQFNILQELPWLCHIIILEAI